MSSVVSVILLALKPDEELGQEELDKIGLMVQLSERWIEAKVRGNYGTCAQIDSEMTVALHDFRRAERMRRKQEKKVLRGL